jgi:glycosyltransferase involved in cell wall biosynthesis
LITISLCMIVKNEEAVLERLLKTMSEVADQIVIMDTGSTDRTKEIAARYTDEVYDFPWKDDFAAARNAACRKAVMDYWMWMDADDVMEPEHAARLKKLKETLDPSVDVVMMKYLTGFDANGRTSFSYYRERLLKNRKGFQWQGP